MTDSNPFWNGVSKEEAEKMVSQELGACNCLRNIPYFDWTHDRDCPLYWPLEGELEMLETPLWARILEKISLWKCCYFTEDEIRFRRKEK